MGAGVDNEDDGLSRVSRRHGDGVTGVKLLALRDFLTEELGYESLRRLLYNAKAVPSDYVLSFLDLRLQPKDVLPEEVYLSIVRAVSTSGSVDADTMGQDFGSFFLTWLTERTRQSLHTVSATFVGFVRALNGLLLQMFECMGNIHGSLPHAHVAEVTPTSFVLGILESATSLNPLSRSAIRLAMYQGMLELVASDVFGMKLTFGVPELRKLPDRLGTAEQHIAMKVTFPEEKPPSAGRLSAVGVPVRAAPVPRPPRPGSAGSERSSIDARGCIMGLDPDYFYKLYPFHLVLDTHFRVLQVGRALQRVVPELSVAGVKANDVFSIRFPKLAWDLECLSLLLDSDQNPTLVLGASGGLTFKGGLYRMRQMQRVKGRLLEGEDALVFLGAPQLTKAEDLERHGMFLSDFMPHETAVDAIILTDHRQGEARRALAEAERDNAALRETLAETLANQDQNADRRKLNTDSAANVLLALLDSLMLGNDVGVQDVLTARNALLRGGSDLWRPLDFNARDIDLDEEVNAALGRMLGASGSAGRVPSPLDTREWGTDGDLASSELFQGTLDLGPGSPSKSPNATSGRGSGNGGGSGGGGGGIGNYVRSKTSGLRRSVASYVGGGVGNVRLMVSGGSGSLERGSQAWGDHEEVRDGAGRRSPPSPPLAGGGGSGGGGSGGGSPAALSPSTTMLQGRMHRSRFEERPRVEENRPRFDDGPGFAETRVTSLLMLQPGGEDDGTLAVATPTAAAAAPAPAAAAASAPLQQRRSSQKALAAAAGVAPGGGGGNARRVSFVGAQGEDDAGEEEGYQSPATGKDGQGGDPVAGGANATAMAASASCLSWFTVKLGWTTQPGVVRPSGPRAAPPLRSNTTPAGFDTDGKAGSYLLDGSDAASPKRGALEKQQGATTAPMRRAVSGLPGSGDAQGRTWDGGNDVAVPSAKQRQLKTLYQPTDQVAACLQQVDAWQFDTFELERVSNNRPLSALAFFLFKKMDLIKQLRLNESKLARFLLRIEDGYPDNPYHSRVHAADVLRTLHVVLTRGGVLSTLEASSSSTVHVLRPHTLTGAAESGPAAAADAANEGPTYSREACITLLTCYLSATVHDYEHRGVNNDFLIKSGDPLALLYNDNSPQENHHLSASFKLLYEDQYAFLPPGLTIREQIRRDTIDLVLATDMKQHFALAGTFSSKVASHQAPMAARGASSNGAASPHAPSGANYPVNPFAQQQQNFMSAGSATLTRGASARTKQRPSCLGHPAGGGAASLTAVQEQQLGGGGGGDGSTGGAARAAARAAAAAVGQAEAPQWDRDTQMLVLKMALKCADLGHLTSKREVHRQWVAKLEEEMFRQGDKERALNHQISPLMDRNKTGITKSQTGFFSVVAMPMFTNFARVFPSCDTLLSYCTHNYELWRVAESPGHA